MNDMNNAIARGKGLLEIGTIEINYNVRNECFGYGIKENLKDKGFNVIVKPQVEGGEVVKEVITVYRDF